MNRFFSTLTVFAILTVGVGLGIRQSLATGADGQIVALQAFAGLGLLTASGFLIRRRYFRRAKLNRASFGLSQPLRRLLAAVWS